MPDVNFFTRPVHEWQRRYEALRASFVERLPSKVVAERFGYSYGYVRLLRHLFTHGKVDFSEPVPEGKTQQRRAISAEYRANLRGWRERRLSAGEIAQLLSEEGVEVSVRTVERVLAEEGFPKLPRRTRLKVGLTVKGAEVPARTERVEVAILEGHTYESACGGVYLFAPFLDKLGFDEIVREARLPGSEAIPAKSYLLSFLALKLLGTERFAHVGDHSFDPGLGLFAGLNVLPKCTAMSSYSYSLGAAHIQRLQQAFIARAAKQGLYDGKIINLDFHSVPHFGEDSVLQKHWVGARGKGMKSALTLFTQDAESRLLLYTNADIKREEADDQVLRFLAFWKGIQRGVQPTLVFDSRFTAYSQVLRAK